MAADDARDAAALVIGEALHGGQLTAELLPGAGGDGRRDRVLGGVLDRAGQAQQLAPVFAGRGEDAGRG